MIDAKVEAMAEELEDSARKIESGVFEPCDPDFLREVAAMLLSLDKRLDDCGRRTVGRV